MAFFPFITQAAKSLEEYRVARWAKGVNRAAQVVLSLTLVAGLNFLAARHFERWDLTEAHRYSLSAETQAYLRRSYLEKYAPSVTAADPIVLTLTKPPNQPNEEADQRAKAVLQEMRDLLRQYENTAQAAPGGAIPLKTEELDVYKQSRETEALTQNGLEPDTFLLVHQGRRSRALKIEDLYEIKDNQEKSFLGESTVTAAILDVIQARPQKIYFTLGHGEMRLTDNSAAEGLTELTLALRRRNFVLSELDLTGGAPVPEDAALVVIARPITPFQPHEVDKLRTYLAQPHGPDQVNGRVITLLEPGTHPGLERLLYQWGLFSDDALVIDPSPYAEQLQGDIVLSSYLDHPITRYLGENQLRVRFGPTRPVREDLGAPLDDRRRVSVLLRTTGSGWGERSYLQGDAKYNKGVDLAGPVSVAALSEEQLLGTDPATQGALGLPTTGGRLLVFGNADFIGNERLNLAGNSYLFLNSVNYLLDRKNVLNIPPKPPFLFNINLTEENLTGLAWRLALPPAVLALVGLVVYFARRR